MAAGGDRRRGEGSPHGDKISPPKGLADRMLLSQRGYTAAPTRVDQFPGQSGPSAYSLFTFMEYLKSHP